MKKGSEDDAGTKKQPVPSLQHRMRLFWMTISGTAEPLRVWGHDKHMSVLFSMTLMRGIAQVLFLDNVVVGSLITLTLMWSDWYTTLCGLICGSFNSITARIVMGSKWYRRPKPTYINSGLFVYNGYLSGATLAVLTFANEGNRFLQMFYLLPFLIISGYMCCIFHIGITNLYPDFPVFSFPFVMAIIFVKPALDHLDLINSNVYPSHLSENQFNDLNKNNNNKLNWNDLLFTSLFRGISQVWLHNDSYVGVMIVLILSIGNYQVSMMSLIGSLMSNVCAQLLFPSINYENVFLQGIHGFNLVLTAVGVGCIYAPFRGFIHIHFLHTLFYCIVCFVVYLSCVTLMSPFGLPTMSLPFNLTSVFFSVYAFRKKYEQEMSRARREEKKSLENGSNGGRARTPSISRAPSVRGAPRYLLSKSVDVYNDSHREDTADVESQLSPRNRGNSESHPAPLAGAPRFLVEPFDTDALQLVSVSKPINVPTLTTMTSNTNDLNHNADGRVTTQLPLKPPSPMISQDSRFVSEITPAPPDQSSDPPHIIEGDSGFLAPPQSV